MTVFTLFWTLELFWGYFYSLQNKHLESIFKLGSQLKRLQKGDKKKEKTMCSLVSPVNKIEIGTGTVKEQALNGEPKQEQHASSPGGGWV